MKARRFAGLSILLSVAFIVAAINLWPGDNPSPGPGPNSESDITVTGIGGGKAAFFSDPDVIRILQDRFGLTVNVTGQIGSIDMIKRCTMAEGWDFCIPQIQWAAEAIKANLGPDLQTAQIIFNTPMVIYTWSPVVDALIQHGLVEQRGDVYYLIDLPKLVQMIQADVQWSDIGLPQLYGGLSITSSDPTLSSSGNTWSALLSSVLNNGNVVDETSVDQVGPQLTPFFNRLLPETSTTLFEQFIQLGMGASPLCALYESQLVEYSLGHAAPEIQKFIRDDIRTLYPTPTIWSTQYLIAMTDGGKRLASALRDEELQRIGWSKHAFRPGVPGVIIDAASLGIPGLPRSVDSVTSLPKPNVMLRLFEILSGAPTSLDRPTSESTPAATAPSSRASPSSVAQIEEVSLQATRRRQPTQG